MKILLISPKIPYPPSDGHKKSIFGVIKYLSKRGHQIDVVAFRQNQTDTGLDGLKKCANLFVLDVETGNTFSGIIKNLFSPVPYNLWKYQRRELTEWLTKYFQINTPDVVQVTNAHMGWVIDVLRKITNVPVLLRQENLEMEIMKRFAENQKNPLKKFYAKMQYKKFVKYEPGLCGKFDLIVLMSREDEQKLLTLNQNVATKIIPVGVDEELLEVSTNPTEKFSLVHIGSLDWYPNLDGVQWFIDEIFPLVVKNFTDAKLYLYGGGNPARLNIDNKIKSNVVLKGFVEDIWSEISDKQLSIVPLRIGGGIRVKILETLAVGQNVITTSIGAEGIPVVDGTHLLVANSPEKFAQKIIDIFSDKIDVESLARNGKKFIQDNFVWEKIAEEFEKSYTRLIKQS